ncbi:hypothetical protein E4P28_09680 [Rothia dentocariosa]|uniref:histone-like protein n=1 Tax=Rothia dentocariosa TaxID=2047 RepID=UPI001071CE3F|nr:hypothetical protein E4P28_09680 [Rothia dentocariosa]
MPPIRPPRTAAMKVMQRTNATERIALAVPCCVYHCTERFAELPWKTWGVK